MRMTRTFMFGACCVAALGWVTPTLAQDDAALGLVPQVAEPAKSGRPRPFRLFGEFAAGRLTQRYGLPTEDARRASIDFTWQFKPAAQWRGVLSNRLDDIHPADQGSRSTLNSLREAFVGWQDGSGRHAVEFGRINVRYGPAYGFNPTDYFRDGASRAVTTPDPLALRENRLGTAMVRAQRLWNGGSLSLAIAPKLRDAPSRESFSVDLGSTNHADRVLLSVSGTPSSATSVRGFLFHERHKGFQLGANGTMLVGDSVVGFAEWSGGRDHDLLSAALDPVAKVVTRQRAAFGMTYTTPFRLAVTAELEYNGFALDRGQWDQAIGTYGVEPLGAYLFKVQQRQDIASRKAALIYLSQRDALMKNLELTGLLRYNAEDRSRFLWAEARYHWPKFDLALQWQTNQGREASEFGAVPGKSLVQLLAAFYF